MKRQGRYEEGGVVERVKENFCLTPLTFERIIRGLLNNNKTSNQKANVKGKVQSLEFFRNQIDTELFNFKVLNLVLMHNKQTKKIQHKFYSLVTYSAQCSTSIFSLWCDLLQVVTYWESFLGFETIVAKVNCFSIRKRDQNIQEKGLLNLILF